MTAEFETVCPTITTRPYKKRCTLPVTPFSPSPHERFVEAGDVVGDAVAIEGEMCGNPALVHRCIVY